MSWSQYFFSDCFVSFFFLNVYALSSRERTGKCSVRNFTKKISNRPSIQCPEKSNRLNPGCQGDWRRSAFKTFLCCFSFAFFFSSFLYLFIPLLAWKLSSTADSASEQMNGPMKTGKVCERRNTGIVWEQKYHKYFGFLCSRVDHLSHSYKDRCDLSESAGKFLSLITLKYTYSLSFFKRIVLIYGISIIQNLNYHQTALKS